MRNVELRKRLSECEKSEEVLTGRKPRGKVGLMRWKEQKSVLG
jgi:hypothetical protein